MIISKKLKLIVNFQRGSILLFTLLILNIILVISLTLAGIFIPKIKGVTEISSSSANAIYAADSALEWCIYINRDNIPVSSPAMENGATYAIIPDDCNIDPLNHRVVGSYRGTSRSLEVTITN